MGKGELGVVGVRKGDEFIGDAFGGLGFAETLFLFEGGGEVIEVTLGARLGERLGASVGAREGLSTAKAPCFGGGVKGVLGDCTEAGLLTGGVAGVVGILGLEVEGLRTGLGRSGLKSISLLEDLEPDLCP